MLAAQQVPYLTVPGDLIIVRAQEFEQSLALLSLGEADIDRERAGPHVHLLAIPRCRAKSASLRSPQTLQPSIDLRGTLDQGGVPASYRSLIEGGWVHYFDYTYGMRHFKAEPLSFGTLQSRLWTVLEDASHEEVSLDRDGMRAIKAWIDFNCPLWSDYTYRPERLGPQTAQAR